MAWTTPRTWVALEKPSAEEMNTHIRDNLNALRDMARLGSGTVTGMPAAGTGKPIRVDFNIPYPVGVVPTVVANGTFTNRNAYASAPDNVGFTLTAVNNSGTQDVNYTYIAVGMT